MSINKHIIEHAKLGIFSNPPTVITVDNNGSGDVNNTESAILLLNEKKTHTLEVSFTGNVTGTSSSTIDIRDVVATGVQTYLTNNIGKVIGFRLDDVAGTTNPITLGIIKSSTTIESLYPLPKDYSTINVDIFTIAIGIIEYQPGHSEVISSALTSPESFTIFNCPVPNSAKLISTVSPQAFPLDTTTNEIVFKNLILSQGSSFGSYIEPPDATTVVEQFMCDYTFVDCTLDTGSADMIFATGVHMGGLKIKGCKFRDHFDAIRVGIPRYLEISGSEFICNNYDTVKYSIGTTIAMGAGVSGHVAYPNIRTVMFNNKIDVRCEDTVFGGTFVPPGYGFEIRSQLPSNAIVDFYNNQVKVHALAGTNEVVGFRASSSAVSSLTPTVMCHDNSFEITNAGSGAKLVMESKSTDIVIQTGRNQIIPGSSSTLGTNTAAITGIEV